MAQLIKNYNFGFPLRTVVDLDNVEQNMLTDDKYGSTLVFKIKYSKIIHGQCLTSKKKSFQIKFLKAKPGSLSDNISALFTDNFLMAFNWDGTNGKLALKNRLFIRSILFG